MSLPKVKQCPKCDSEMELLNEVYALTIVKKNEDKSVSFIPASGMPVKVYMCKKCAMVELYSAILTGEF